MNVLLGKHSTILSIGIQLRCQPDLSVSLGSFHAL